MKNKIPKLFKLSALVGMSVAPFAIMQGQVIETDRGVPKALAVNTLAAAAKPDKGKKDEKQRGNSSIEKRQKSQSAAQVRSNAPKKPQERKMSSVAPASDEKSRGPANSKKPKDTIKDIAKKAAEKSVAPVTAAPRSEKPEPRKANQPPTDRDIARKAAEKATGKPSVNADKQPTQVEEKLTRKPAPTEVRDGNPPMKIERESAADRAKRERIMAETKGKGEPKGKGKPVAKGGVPVDPSAPVESEVKGKPEVVASQPVNVDPEEEKKVVETTRKVEQEVNRKKMDIESPAEAQDIIRQVIGSESELARTEKDRDQRVRGRTFDRDGDRDRFRRGDDESTRDEIVSYLLRRFRGEADLADAPASFRHGNRFDRDRRFDDDDRRRRDYRDRDDHRDHDHYDGHYHHPIHNGRRHVSYRNRGDIPAILLAVSALNRLHVNSYREIDYLPTSGPGYVQVPQEYREPESYVVSYDVDPNSMVSRDDILFQQGSTSFADEYSYQIVEELAEAMRDPSLANERFVIEGHASAEGGYEYNQELSQRRAERIVRDMVRLGVSPDRLVPVGYGESEAEFAANAAEGNRRYDRKVVVFRMSE